jgi:ankyrin repeat protein
VQENPVATKAARPEPVAAKPQHRSRRTSVEPLAPWAPRESFRARGSLSDALQARDTERLRALLDRGAQPNGADGQLSPLHEAVRMGEASFVRMLLEKGANPNARDSAGETPLHEALRRRDYEIVGALLDFGANPNLPDRTGLTPLQAAGNDGTLRRRLLEKGAH